MAGLLDFIGTPEGQGLLSAAFGGLAGARRGQPLNSLGRAGLSGLSGYADATDRQTQADQLAKRNQMFDLHLAQMRQAQTDAEVARTNEAAFRSSIPNPQLSSAVNHALTPVEFGASLPTSGLSGAGPAPAGDGFGFTVPRLTAPDAVDPRHQQLWQAMHLEQIKPLEYLNATAKDDATVKLAPGETLFSGRASGFKPLATGGSKASDETADVRNYQFAVGQGYRGTFTQFQLDQRKAGASNVTYGAPVSGVDANGNPIFFQPGRDGGAPAIIPGVKPAPKEVPEGIRTKLAENAVVLEKIRKAQGMTTDSPDAFGIKNVLGDTIMQRWDPDGTEARAFVADIAGQKIHDRSGAAVSVGESERLKPYIPNVTDRADTVEKKLKAFEAEYSAIQRELQSGASVGQATSAKAETPVRVRKFVDGKLQ